MAELKQQENTKKSGLRRWNPFRLILFDTILAALLFLAGCRLLDNFGLQLREWVYIMTAVLMLVGGIAGVIQLISKIPWKTVRIVGMTIAVILMLLASPALFLGAVFGYSPEHVVWKHGEKYVAYVRSFLETDVYYFEYKNIFTAGKQVRIIERYGNGSFDPFGDRYGHKYDAIQTTYYDENGKVISDDGEI